MEDTLVSAKLVCGAPTKDGGLCQRPPGVGGHCPQHQVDAPSEAGRWGKAVPPRLLDRYQQSANDPDQLALCHDIALLDARLDDLLRRVGTGESGDAWKRLRKIFAEFYKAHEADDDDRMDQKVEALNEIIAEGAGDETSWAEVLSLLEQRHRLVESEQKRLQVGKLMMKTDDAWAYMDALIQSVKRHVKDSAALTALNDDFTRILRG
jgi:hypothetical protein